MISTHNYLCQTFAAVGWKIATWCTLIVLS